ncbi:MAG TPA: nucleotidyltransferase domain-containing protein [Gemmataceae bacterium]|jgi:hypothetical protein|nr:nucleotidyltransferase domain-containing protein [Gemmataceae bacterium]
MRRKPRANPIAEPEPWYRGDQVPMAAIRKYARQVAEHFKPDKIILFGSHAYGTPNEDSDVKNVRHGETMAFNLWAATVVNDSDGGRLHGHASSKRQHHHSKPAWSRSACGAYTSFSASNTGPSTQTRL